MSESAVSTQDRRDQDVLSMSPEELMWEVLSWRALVRLHRDQRYKDRSWLTTLELYKKLPEGLPEDIHTMFQLPSLDEFEQACKVQCRHHWFNEQDPSWRKFD